MTVIWLLAGAAVLVAFSNGANDNFKGVATLYGSRTASYGPALRWGTVTTFAGSLASVVVARGLIGEFSGKGLVLDSLVGDPHFMLAVGTGAAATVLVASLAGIPISTTHSLAGALLGAALAFRSPVDFRALGQMFFLPLLVSPFASLALTAALYPALRRARATLGVGSEMCICMADGSMQEVCLGPDGTAVLRSSGLALTVDQLSACQQRYSGYVFGFDAQRLLGRLHFVSSGLVGFARGLNDTPKMVALLVAARGLALAPGTATAIVAAAVALGGLVGARQVAATMSERIVGMNPGQGLAANFVTALLVVVASRFGLPVSTTHVSCGSLFGLGVVNGTGRWRMIRAIVLAWVATLPLAGLLAAGAALWILG